MVDKRNGFCMEDIEAIKMSKVQCGADSNIHSDNRSLLLRKHLSIRRNISKFIGTRLRKREFL